MHTNTPSVYELGCPLQLKQATLGSGHLRTRNVIDRAPCAPLFHHQAGALSQRLDVSHDVGGRVGACCVRVSDTARAPCARSQRCGRSHGTLERHGDVHCGPDGTGSGECVRAVCHWILLRAWKATKSTPAHTCIITATYALQRGWPPLLFALNVPCVWGCPRLFSKHACGARAASRHPIVSFFFLLFCHLKEVRTFPSRGVCVSPHSPTHPH